MKRDKAGEKKYWEFYQNITVFWWSVWIRMDTVKNEEVHERAGIEREMAWTVDQRLLRWFGH